MQKKKLQTSEEGDSKLSQQRIPIFFFEMADSVDKGKKRKKHTDGSSRPSKKVAIEGDRKIKISLQAEDQWAPIIGMQDHLTRL
jgi:hypothetical protein